MKECDIECLDKMFPDGYLIVYTCPDKQIRLSMNNPHRLEDIYKYKDILQREADGDWC